ncbi:MAG: family N-acetyltransferase [Actinotalea sp.]|nr:family N-acetyltransferase [Actinotalea sp.]
MLALMASTTSSPAVPDERMLPSGLVLRTARPADLEQIGELLADRGEPADRLDHRLVVEDPDLGWESCAVVADGDRIVSTALLLDETLRVDDVVLPAGQVELVATVREYEGRGLVRALMGWAHERSEDRGHLLQVMIGIPYFYRLFGYEYAIDIPRARPLTEPPLQPSPGGPTATLRRAEPRDIRALAALQDAVQSTFDVAMPHPAARWRWLLEHEASTTWVLERDGVVVASARTGPPDDGVLVGEPAAADREAADGLLRALVAELGPELTIVDRRGTPTGHAWASVLGDPPVEAEQYYARLAAPERVLDALRPVLHRRLVAAGLDRVGKDVVVSTYGRHYRMAVTEQGLGPVVVGGAMQAPGAAGGVGVAPDHLAALLLGPRGVDGLARIRPDVYAGRDAELYGALFPPLTADLLTYYLPW